MTKAQNKTNIPYKDDKKATYPTKGRRFNTKRLPQQKTHAMAATNSFSLLFVVQPPKRHDGVIASFEFLLVPQVSPDSTVGSSGRPCLRTRAELNGWVVGAADIEKKTG
jgi:hypothetical protein